MKKFKLFLDKNIGINDKEWDLLKDSIQIQQLKKNDILDYPNNIWSKIIFINSGLIRSYIINNEGKDFTRQFYFNTNESRTANLFVIDLTSILTEKPSSRGFEVLSDSEIIVFSKEKLFELYAKYHKWEHIGRKMAEFAYIDMDKFYCAILTKTPKERYVYLSKIMPKLLEITPQYHIATYLGITPVTLSRIKKELK